MRLYHFLNAEYALMDVRHRRLKIARINQLNDPFEFLGVATKSRELRRRYETMKDGLNEFMGLLCFSANWNNPVQWSHYADNHHGLCLGFDVASVAHKVAYVTERLPSKPRALQVEASAAEAHVMEILTTKFEHWRYEDEYRVFPHLDEPDQTGLYFYQFDERIALREIIVGHHASITRDELARALGTLAPQVQVHKARLAFRTFGVVRQKNDRLWK